MQIDKLLEDYFEGKTSCEEERELRLYFASDEVRDDLRKYKPLFAYFDEEISKNQSLPRKEVKLASAGKEKRLWVYPVAAAVACFVIVFGWGRFIHKDTHFCGENYVVINGRCYTDIHKIRSFAEEALEEVSNTNDMLGLELVDQNSENRIVKDQLKEFDFLLEKDERIK